MYPYVALFLFYVFFFFFSYFFFLGGDTLYMYMTLRREVGVLHNETVVIKLSMKRKHFPLKMKI